MARAKTLRFTGKRNAQGEPDRWFVGVPARDLDAVEVKQLSDEDYTNITGGTSPLYVDAAAAPKADARKPAAGAKKAPQKPKATATKRAASAPAGAEATPGGDAPETPAP